MMPGRIRGPHPPQPLMAPTPAALETLWGEGLSAGGSSPDICQGEPAAGTQTLWPRLSGQLTRHSSPEGTAWMAAQCSRLEAWG